MEIFRTTEGIARREGDELVVLELDYPDVGALLQEGIDLARTARVRSRLPLAGARLRTPVGHPKNLILSGLMYPDHCAEAGIPEPTAAPAIPLPGGKLDDPGLPIVIPAGSGLEVDYEAELAVVIGRSAFEISDDEGWSCIAGLMILNDVGERKAQKESMSKDPWDYAALAASKSHPSFKPCGPGMVTIDEFDKNPDLEIRTLLNGNVVQHDWTRNMLFSLGEIVAAASRKVRLVPGDVISTGTPAGVGLATGRYLRPGDLVEVEIERLGTLTSPVEGPAEPRA